MNGEDYPSAVNYWIPFDGNLGISDAPWRMDFGGQLYEFEGTHGSILSLIHILWGEAGALGGLSSGEAGSAGYMGYAEGE